MVTPEYLAGGQITLKGVRIQSSNCTKQKNKKLLKHTKCKSNFIKALMYNAWFLKMLTLHWSFAYYHSKEHMCNSWILFEIKMVMKKTVNAIIKINIYYPWLKYHFVSSSFARVQTICFSLVYIFYWSLNSHGLHISLEYVIYVSHICPSSVIQTLFFKFIDTWKLEN